MMVKENQFFLKNQIAENLQENAWKKLVKIIQDNLSTLTLLNLYGGEPSIDPNFANLIDNLCKMDLSDSEKNSIEMRIFTNGMWLNDKAGINFVKQLVKAKTKGWNIVLRFSIDAIAEEAEYIRAGTNWELLNKNLDFTMSQDLCHEVSITTSLFNLSIQQDIMRWILDKPYGNNIKPIPNLANRPAKISIANLGNHIFDFMPDWKFLPYHNNWQEYQSWIAKLAEQQKDGQIDSLRLKEFIMYTKWFADASRVAIPPKLVKIYDRYKMLL
jgi:hypothetical protein